MRRKLHTFSILLTSLLVFSCIEENQMIPEEIPSKPTDCANTISPNIIYRDDPKGEKLPPYATKSLVSHTTTQKMVANFLRLDEEIGVIQIDGQQHEHGTYTFPKDWSKARIMEASVISSPGSELHQYKRSVTLAPVQSYKINEYTQKEKKCTTYYHTRMISWYPKTCTLPQKNGIISETTFDYFTKKNVGVDAYDPPRPKEKNISINFTNLDGSKDVMVSEVREAQQRHKYTGEFLTGDVTVDGKDIYRQPFGREENQQDQNGSSFEYDNCFEYHHYLSAFRLYAFSDNSDQDTGMWGKILGITIKNQPSKCTVVIPEFDEKAPNATNSRKYGNCYFEENSKTNFPIQKGAMFGEDGNAGPQEIAPDNPTIGKTPTYLGYSLVQPNNNIELEIHTESGIYSITVDKKQDGKDVFKEGYIYNIYLNFSTNGKIASMLIDDASGDFWDLTTGDVYGIEGFTYKTANCYFVDPGMINPKTNKPYDGYTFLANVMGNGNKGILPGFHKTSAELNPVNAGLIWESKHNLVTQVEFMYNYVRFQVKDPNAQGNAVIGVYNEQNKLIWSWHIWISNQNLVPGRKETDMHRPGDVLLNIDGQDYFFMDRNLGAIRPYKTNATGQNLLDSYGLYYQWGRKDPSMTPPSATYIPMSTACSDYFDFYGNRLSDAGIVHLAHPSITDGIQNPMYLILPSSLTTGYSYNWLGENIGNLWGGTDQKKTIYDPCPFGYKVPSNELELIYNNSGTTKTVERHGAIFNHGNNKVTFPFAGYKGVDRGMSSVIASWKYVGEKGDYMSSNLHTTKHRARLYMSYEPKWIESGADADGDGFGDKTANYSGQFHYDYANRRTAASVRCVREDFMYDPTIQASFQSPFPPFIFLGSSFDYSVRSVNSYIQKITLKDEADYINPQEHEYSGKQDFTGKVTFAKDQYDQIGTHNYTLYAENTTGQKTDPEIKQVLDVINISNIHSIKYGSTTITPAVSLPMNISDEARQSLTFKINTRGDHTVKEDLDLLNKHCKIVIKETYKNNLGNVRYDATNQTFISDAGSMNGKQYAGYKLPIGPIIFSIQDKETGKELKRFELASEYHIADLPLSTSKSIKNNLYYAIREADGKQRFWSHDGGTALTVTPLTNNRLALQNLFKIEKDPNFNASFYFEIYKTGFIDKDFSIVGQKYRHDFKDIDKSNNVIKIGRDDGSNFWGGRKVWSIKVQDSQIKWSWQGQEINTGQPWNIYPVNISFPNDPVEVAPTP